MSDRAISKEALLSGLRDIRLPEPGPMDMLANVTATIALASGAALLIVFVWRLLSSPRLPDTPPSTRDLDHLPDAERRVALLHMLKARAPDRYAALRSRLYRPDGDLDLATLEAEVARHV
ncbi:MAG: hypothetical protein NXH74_11660 [Rhodobacteraceae bacterium]|nr:hypothetical protein [Paracoccaceae bacterium]